MLHEKQAKLEDEIVKFYQNCLFFDLVGDVFGFRINPEVCKQNDGSGTVAITTRHLPELVYLEYAFPRAEERQHLESAIHAISFVSGVLRAWQEIDSRPIDIWMALSLTMLVRYLADLLSAVFWEIEGYEVDPVFSCLGKIEAVSAFQASQ
jgi:hypothetical protein